MRTRIVSGLLGILLALSVVGFQGSVMALDLGLPTDQGHTLDEVSETLTEPVYTTLPPDIEKTINELPDEHCTFANLVLESQGYESPNVTQRGFEYDPVNGPCAELRDRLQHAIYQGEDLPYYEDCRRVQGFHNCIALGHHECDFAIFAVNGVVYICKGGLTPYN
jgi:hypothetical protein